MSTVNVAVVGLGFMGVTHLKAYRQIPGVRIAAICDAARLPVDGDFSAISGNIGSDEPFKLDMENVKATKNLDELLNDPDIDLIDLCVPTLVHPKLAIAALQAGKHVVCEKPLARTAALAREIVEAAEAAQGFFMPAMCIRFWPEYAWLKQAIAGREYGRVLAARFRRVSEPPGWSDEFMDGGKSGGALLDLHVHDADFVQYCFGRPQAVYATGLSAVSGAIDHVVAQYTVEGGACVSAEGGWAMTPGFGFNMSYTVLFENATVDFDNARGDDALRLYEKDQPPRTIKPEGGDGYLGELTHMVESIRAGQAPTIVTPRDGLGAVEICEAEGTSIETGQIVELLS
ncbi:MAG: Gfo/Idh/MocA family oxidoreductase [Kiritimatiellales bacterium]|nr:Gfo/Idh/MocA family oxidoreductase [Kiritimatiellales bacterium]